ncbi:MAG: hypothetical protein GYA51_03080 [Candidatus Methanofastidiosa archaeon]|jgi:hypothetical protein|nr:hypothetical protein [Candidatus Methanofastidiosa archaeon]
MRKEREMPRSGIIGLVSLLMGIMLIGVIKHYSNIPETHNLILLSCFLYILFISVLSLALYSGLFTKIRREVFPNRKKSEFDEDNYDEIKIAERLHCPFCNANINNYWEKCPECGKSLDTVSTFSLAPLKGKILTIIIVFAILIWYTHGIVSKLGYDEGTEIANELIEECNSEVQEYQRISRIYNQKVDTLYKDIYIVQINVTSSDEEIEKALAEFDKISKDRYDGLKKIQYEMDFHLVSARGKLEEASKIPLQDWQKEVIELKTKSINKSLEKNEIFSQGIYNEIFVYRKSWLILNGVQTFLRRTAPRDDIIKNPILGQMIPHCKESIIDDKNNYQKSMYMIYKINNILKLDSLNNLLISVKCNLKKNEEYVDYLDALERKDYEKANEIFGKLKYEECQEYIYIGEAYEDLNEWYTLNPEDNYNKSKELSRESEKFWLESEKIRLEKKK